MVFHIQVEKFRASRFVSPRELLHNFSIYHTHIILVFNAIYSLMDNKILTAELKLHLIMYSFLYSQWIPRPSEVNTHDNVADEYCRRIMTMFIHNRCPYQYLNFLPYCDPFSNYMTATWGTWLNFCCTGEYYYVRLRLGCI